jgi:hypothetical protein
MTAHWSQFISLIANPPRQDRIGGTPPFFLRPRPDDRHHRIHTPPGAGSSARFLLTDAGVAAEFSPSQPWGKDASCLSSEVRSPWILPCCRIPQFCGCPNPNSGRSTHALVRRTGGISAIPGEALLIKLLKKADSTTRRDLFRTLLLPRLVRIFVPAQGVYVVIDPLTPDDQASGQARNLSHPSSFQ